MTEAFEVARSVADMLSDTAQDRVEREITFARSLIAGLMPDETQAVRDAVSAALVRECVQRRERDGSQGWTNRETWRVMLWIGNEQASYELARMLVRNEREHVGADKLERYVREAMDSVEANTNTVAIWSKELASDALCRVNWPECVRSLLEP